MMEILHSFNLSVFFIWWRKSYMGLMTQGLIPGGAFSLAKSYDWEQLTKPFLDLLRLLEKSSKSHQMTLHGVVAVSLLTHSWSVYPKTQWTTCTLFQATQSTGWWTEVTSSQAQCPAASSAQSGNGEGRSWPTSHHLQLAELMDQSYWSQKSQNSQFICTFSI